MVSDYAMTNAFRAATVVVTLQNLWERARSRRGRVRQYLC